MTIDRDIRRLMAQKILTDDPQEKARLTAKIESAENARSFMTTLRGAEYLTEKRISNDNHKTRH